MEDEAKEDEEDDVVKPPDAMNGVHRKLNLNNPDTSRHERSSNSTKQRQQQKYGPPGMNGPAALSIGKSHVTSADTAEKLANLKVGPPSCLLAKPSAPPRLMKAGGWRGKSDLLHSRSQDAIPGRARKVAG